MYRFRKEQWVEKYLKNQPQKWKVSSSVVGQFETEHDYLHYGAMKTPYNAQLNYGRLRHLENDDSIKVEHSLRWDTASGDNIPAAGVKSTHVGEKYGSYNPKDTRLTPKRKSRAHAGIRLKPLAVSHGRRSTHRAASPNYSETSNRSSSLGPLMSTRSEGGESRWQFRYQTPWKYSKQNGMLSTTNPNYDTPGWK